MTAQQQTVTAMHAIVKQKIAMFIIGSLYNIGRVDVNKFNAPKFFFSQREYFREQRPAAPPRSRPDTEASRLQPRQTVPQG